LNGDEQDFIPSDQDDDFQSNESYIIELRESDNQQIEDQEELKLFLGEDYDKDLKWRPLRATVKKKVAAKKTKGLIHAKNCDHLNVHSEPIDFFQLIFTEELIENIVNQSNKYYNATHSIKKAKKILKTL